MSESIEKYRNQCEVRHCIRVGIKDRNVLDGYLAMVEKHRGADEAKKLRTDSRAQYAAGNRGKFGEWIEGLRS